MLSPRWKKDARLLSKGARKFLNYKRDLMGEEQVSHIEDARLSLNLAIKAGDRERIAETSQLLTEACENALSGYRRPGFIAENLEVLFVAIVIALGIRGYFLQPFRIPTGSMQPTLNGIVGHELTKDEFPSVPIRTWQAVMNGRRCSVCHS